MTIVQTAPTNPDADAAADAFAERLFSAALGGQLLQSLYLGEKLGFYRALADDGPATPAELARSTGTHERYAREWLEHQAICAVLDVDDQHAPPGERRYTLGEGHAEVLTHELSLRYLTPVVVAVAGLGTHLGSLVDAYRTGGGVSWQQLGDDAREGQAALNRPLFLGPLGRELLPSVPAIDARLRAGGLVADVGCGFGWSSIGIALAYPEVTVDGFDVDAPSIEGARRNAAEAGVADRVRFHLVDAAQQPASTEGRYDLVTAFECIHDLPDPVGVLATMRRMAGPDGVVLVMDERGDEAFSAPGDEVQQFLYGFSITVCLPDGMSAPRFGRHRHRDAAGDPARVCDRGRLHGIEVLPIEHDFFRFYRLQ